MITLFFALLLAQEKTVVEGSAVNALTGEPLPKTRVVLNDGKTEYAAISARDGKFQFEDVAPGAYLPQAKRQGFLDDFEEEEVVVAPGQHVKDVVLKLTPQGVIAGHVVDEDGDPLAEASVIIERSIMVDGRKEFFESDSENTNSEGYFFVGALRAGRYHVSAVLENNNPPMIWRTGDKPREDFVRTENPMPIDLAPGGAVRNVEIRLRKSAVFRVRGLVTNAPNERRSLQLSNDSISYTAPIRSGSFSFESVAPGRYSLKISSFFYVRPDGSATPATAFCNVPVTVSDHDLDGVIAEFGPGANVDGSIRIEGGGHFEKPPSIAIAVLGLQSVTTKEDGTFGWTNLSPNRHAVDFAPPKGFYVKSVQFNHEPVKNWVIDLSAGGGSLEIVVAPGAASITATVSGAKTAKLALWNDSRSLVMNLIAGGVVKFTDLAPGEYRISAWENIDPEYLQIPEFRARFDAQKITLTEGAHQDVEVKLIPKSTAEAEIAKLQ